MINEQEYLDVIRSMDDRHQEDMLRFLMVVAQRHPRPVTLLLTYECETK